MIIPPANLDAAAVVTIKGDSDVSVVDSADYMRVLDTEKFKVLDFFLKTYCNI